MTPVRKLRLIGDASPRSQRVFILSARAMAVGIALACAAHAVAEEGRPLHRNAHSKTVVSIDRAELQARFDSQGFARVVSVPLPGGEAVDLALDHRSAPASRTQFVVGQVGGPDRDISGAVAEALVLRGRVPGHADSFVFLSLSSTGVGGIVDLGRGGARYRITNHPSDGSSLPQGHVAVEPMIFIGQRGPDTPSCAVGAMTAPVPAREPALGPSTPPKPGPHVIRLAVETDHELFQLFGDPVATASYTAAVFAEVSAICERDVDARVDLTFVRVWDDWNDLFNEPDPLNAFRSFWNANMQAVPRDVAQFFSGRRDLPYGGVAFLGSLCGNNGYSVVGYAMGMFPDPQFPSVFNYDIFVTAHELGHNIDAPHTHDIGLDNCFSLDTPARRGTIMSYCSQTVSGGNAVSDLRFHRGIQAIIEPYLEGLTCLTHDCNGNGIADETEILGGAPDANGNNVPDECEDCNNNGTLDPADIAAMTSTDLNLNGVPDECEPDCNGNNIPDDVDIASSFSADLDNNVVPDECQVDCDNDGTADTVEILANMTLDRDRDNILDACQDCDNDGMTDLAELDNAHAAWLAGHEGGVKAFHAASGVVTIATDAMQVDEPNDVLVTPDGRVLVTSGHDHRVVEFDRTGATVGDFVNAGSGGLATPTGITRGPNGNVFVSSSGSHAVLEYDGTTGAFVGVFVAPGAGGLVSPFGLEFGPNGNLFVTSNDSRILEFNGATGAFVGEFVSNQHSGGLDNPRGIAFKPDGNLLAASFSTRSVLEYDGATGNLLRKFNRAGTDVALTMAGPWGVRIGPDGQVYISRHFHNGDPDGGGHDDDHSFTGGDDPQPLHVNSTRIYQFEARTGNFIRSYITGNDTGLRFSTGFDFMPGWGVDCNNNQLIDSCDIASGASVDGDRDGTPDECEADCNSNSVPDRLELWPDGPLFDCNGNGVPDACDIAGGVSRDCNGDNRPDECEATAVLFDNFERDRGWTTAVLGATAGQWQRGTPINDPGSSFDPAFDADFGGQCWLTQNTPGDSDVDNGAVRLISPIMDMSAGVITMSYEYYLRLSNTNGGVDRMLVEISSNGPAGPWTQIALHTQNGGLNWHYHQIDHDDLMAAGVSLTSTMQVRFTVNDANPQSTVEAGLDTFHVTATLGPTYLNLGDMNCDCNVNGLDIAAFVQALLDPQGYATTHVGCSILLGDLTDDGNVDESDIGPMVDLLLGR